VTPVTEALRALEVSFVLASAYNQLDLGAVLLAKAPNAGKPTSERRLLAMLGKAVGS
jgi:hypothetical protein